MLWPRTAPPKPLLFGVCGQRQTLLEFCTYLVCFKLLADTQSLVEDRHTAGYPDILGGAQSCIHC